MTERERVARHEARHAVASLLLFPERELASLTCVTDGAYRGQVKLAAPIRPTDWTLDDLKVMLAGDLMDGGVTGTSFEAVTGGRHPAGSDMARLAALVTILGIDARAWAMIQWDTRALLDRHAKAIDHLGTLLALRGTMTGAEFGRELLKCRLIALGVAFG